MIKLHNQILIMDIEQQKQSVYFLKGACGIDYLGLVKIDMKGLMYINFAIKIQPTTEFNKKSC